MVQLKSSVVLGRLTPLNLLSWRSDWESKPFFFFFFCSLCVRTKVIIKGELVVVPNLKGEFRRHLRFSLIQTPEVLLKTQRVEMYKTCTYNA